MIYCLIASYLSSRSLSLSLFLSRWNWVWWLDSIDSISLEITSAASAIFNDIHWLRTPAPLSSRTRIHLQSFLLVLSKQRKWESYIWNSWQPSAAVASYFNWRIDHSVLLPYITANQPGRERILIIIKIYKTNLYLVWSWWVLNWKVWNNDYIINTGETSHQFLKY